MDAGHYKINRLFMSWIGQWPEQPKFYRLFFSLNIILAVSSQFFLQICALVPAWQDWDFVLECIPSLFIHMLFFVKFLNCLFNSYKIESLLIQMRNTWNLAAFDGQIQILRAYTAEGKKLSRTYAAIIYGCMSFYMVLPISPSIVAYLTNANQTQMYGLLYRVETILNVEKYYYFILLHSYYTTFFLMTIPVATDSMLIIYVQHVCGLLAAIGYENVYDNAQDYNGLLEILDRKMHVYQLENVKRDDEIDIKMCPLSEDKHYRTIRDSIRKHKVALQFAELLASTYTVSLFALTVLNVAIITFSGVETLISLGQPLEALRKGISMVCMTMHFLFLSMPGQKLIDHSTDVYQSICAMKWYAISVKARKLLNLTLIRSKVPCRLTAGKMCTMSLYTFGKVIQASMSYFTVLTSLR